MKRNTPLHRIRRETTERKHPGSTRAPSLLLALITTLTCLWGAGAANAQNRLYVDAKASPGGNGRTWETAFGDLQQALNLRSVSGSAFSEIWVASGTYLPSEPEGNPTFALQDGLAIYGGFLGNETSLEERGAVLSSHLSGDLGIVFDPSDNAANVVTAVGITGARLDGFTILGGMGDRGGGIYIENSSAATIDEQIVIANTKITQNGRAGETGTEGGGVCIAASSNPRFIDCEISDNEGLLGGGAFIEDSAPEFLRCNFTDNRSSLQGGGASVSQPSALGAPSFTDCVFLGNSADSVVAGLPGAGGGLDLKEAEVLVVGCEFRLNTAEEGGGIAVSSPGSQLSLEGSSFLFNSGTTGAGGLHVFEGVATVSSALFAFNFANGSAGAILVDASPQAVFTGLTVVNNGSQIERGGILISDSLCMIANSILWDNGDGNQSDQIDWTSSPPDVNNSCIDGYAGGLGTGNIASDPGFVDRLGPDGFPSTGDENFEILVSSPCVDTGDDGRVIASIDARGAPRILTTVDMGAYEYYPDSDFDGTIDPFDNCPSPIYNPTQADADGDGFGDDCDGEVTHLTPNAGRVGLEVTVHGSGFLEWEGQAPRVFFVGDTVESEAAVLAHTETEILVAVPSSPDGQERVDVRVELALTRLGVPSTSLLVDAFTYTEFPVLVGERLDFRPGEGFVPQRIRGPVYQDPRNPEALYAVDEGEIWIDWRRPSSPDPATRILHFSSYPTISVNPTDPASDLVIDISAGDGAPVPTGVEIEGIFDESRWNCTDPDGTFLVECSLNENDEFAFIYEAPGASPRVFATRPAVDDRYVLLRHRDPGAARALGFQVYRVVAGSRFDGERFVDLDVSVGEQLEPIPPLGDLYALHNQTLADENILVVDHARIWRNPGEEQLSQIFVVNANPVQAPRPSPPTPASSTSKVYISWPRITTRRGLDGHWNIIAAHDPSVACYTQEFQVRWDGESWDAARTIPVDNQPAVAGLPAWDASQLGASFSIERATVFDAEMRPTGQTGNENDEHAVIYRLESELAPSPGDVNDWGVYALRAPTGSFGSPDREGGEGWVLIRYASSTGEVAFAGYEVIAPPVRRTLVVGERLLPYFPLSEILYGPDLTLPAELALDIIPDLPANSIPLADQDSTGWWIHDLRGALEPGLGSHIYCVNRGNPKLDPADPDPVDPHISVRWRIPRGTLGASDEVEREAYYQRFDVVWPDATPGWTEVRPDGTTLRDARTVFIKGLFDDARGELCVRDVDFAGCHDPRIFDGVGAASIDGGLPPAEDINPNDEHGLILSGKLYAGRDDSFRTPPWVLMGYRETQDGPLVFATFRVERSALDLRDFVVGSVVQPPAPYLYLSNYELCPDTRIVKDPPVSFSSLGWKAAPDDLLWIDKSWPRPHEPGVRALFHFEEWWYPEAGRPGRNDCLPWIDDIEITARWPAEEGIGPGRYTRIQVGEAIDRSAHGGIELLFSPSDLGDPEAADLELFAERGREACLDTTILPRDGFCIYRGTGLRAENGPGAMKFISAIGERTKASPADGDRWATIATFDEVVNVEVFKVECPPVRGRLIAASPSCIFSPQVKLIFWPFRRSPEEYGAVLLENGLYDEDSIPRDLIDALYPESLFADIDFEWEWMSASAFLEGRTEWLPDLAERTRESELVIDDGSGIQILQDRVYRVRYSGFDACRGTVPPASETDLQIRTFVDGAEVGNVLSDGPTPDVLTGAPPLIAKASGRVDESEGGGLWWSLGQFDLAGGSILRVTFGGGGHTFDPAVVPPQPSADAVRFTRLTDGALGELSASERRDQTFVVDNGDSGAATGFSWSTIDHGGAWLSYVSPSQYGADALYSANREDTYSWELTAPVGADGVYEIAVRWPRGAPGVELDAATSTWYSPWTDPMLLPSWIKRIVQGADLENFKLDSFEGDDGQAFISALELIGQRPEDRIAFNCDPANFNQLGLLELYTNVLHHGQAFSIGDGSTAGFNDADANQALLLAAKGIHDMYMVLGNEAFADALDPTIGTVLGDGSDLEPEQYFAFFNQVPGLLEEELVLLRGRSRDRTLLDFTSPVYNRLTWNFTDDLAKTIYTTAYRDAGIIDIDDARRVFAQGHGDAWGHYLSAVKVYYSLLENGYFSWPGDGGDIEFVLVANRPVQVGFQHARRFAQAVAARSRAGREIVALEFRKQYRADPEKHFSDQGYLDSHTDEELLARNSEGLIVDSFPEGEEDRAWGVHDWATRAALGTYLDWAVVTSRLPAESEQVGLRKVDRSTVTELDEISSNLQEITRQVDTVDSGLNPLGLARNIVPFDIDPVALQEENLTHYEQVQAKAEIAIGNAVAVLQFANQSRNRLREQQGDVELFKNNIENEEFRYKSRLIEIFGKPYPQDPAYPVDYDGPDLIHHAIIDMQALAHWDCLRCEADLSDTFTRTFKEVIYEAPAVLVEERNDPVIIDGNEVESGSVYNLVADPNSSHSLAGSEVELGDHLFNFQVREGVFQLDREYGFLARPEDWTRPRLEEGQLQASLRQIHLAIGRLEQARLALGKLIADIEADLEYLEELHGVQTDRLELLVDNFGTKHDLVDAMNQARFNRRLIDQVMTTAWQTALAISGAIPTNLVFGMASGGDLTAPIRGALLAVGIAAEAVQFLIKEGEFSNEDQAQEALRDLENAESIVLTGLGDRISNLQVAQGIQSSLRSLPGAVSQANLAREELIQAVSGYGSVLGRGLRLIEERDRFRHQTVRQVRDYRHRDRTYRLFHNDALQKYRAQFDLASRYAFLAVQTLDYETNLLGTGHRLGRFDDLEEALEAVIRARSPGALLASASQGSGLTGVLQPLASVFEHSLKPALRIPQFERREFSLRKSLFQIPPFRSHDAGWRDVLTAATVDLRDAPEIRRLAQIDETILADVVEGNDPVGIVLRFPTLISSRVNFFNQISEGGDPGFSPEHLSTKILRAGIYLSDYPSGSGKLSPTPHVYLIPAGASVMRVPVRDVPGEPRPVREMQLVDQLIPPVIPTFLDDQTFLAPEAFGLDDVDWRPGRLLQGCPDDTCFFGRVRKIGPFVAGSDASDAGNPGRTPSYSGLLGRTAWNTEWILVIPGKTLGAPGADSALGLRWFTHGAETGEGQGVSDIRLIFDAYSYENPLD